MAGIAGVLGSSAFPQTVARMLAAIKHRGPDTSRAHEADGLCAGVCSAKLSDARGDGFARDGGVAVLFDGDIYNDRPAGQSDAEVALSLYREHGRTFPGYLQGVFACAVCDGGEVLLARDAVGVRPLYVGRAADGDVCFASEMKALVSLAQEVAEIHPATTWSSAVGVAAYLPRYPQTQVPPDFDEAAKRLRRIVTDAVARRLEDGAVGACLLSGGLDSSVIAAVAHELKGNLPAITVGMEGAPDLDNAALLARELGIEHRVRLYDLAEIERLVPHAVWMLESFDEDCVSGAIANLAASSEAAKSTRSILSGEGGDELFGGYHLLKELAGENERLRMMQRLIEVAYNTAVQRLDRAMMGHSIHYRTPFIDTHVIAYALQLPVRWKIHPNGEGEPVEKYILREAFGDLLPEKIYKRPKLRFSAGTGTDGLMDELAKDKLGEGEFSEQSRRTEGGYTLSSPKELWYYKLFREKFGSLAFEKLVGRWDPGK